MNDDHDLIREFASNRSEQAFRRLVDRHCDLVYSVATRVTRDPDLARDVSQQVFSKLAAKPKSVPADVPLAAWLHRSTRSLAIDLVRSEQARRQREISLSTSPAMNSEPAPDWARLEPVIDSLIDELPEIERRAVVMRFYEKRSHSAIGAVLGLSEEAARKRLDRGLERLRGLLAKRGIATTSAALATVLPAHAITPAPAGFAASLSSTALSTAALTTASTSAFIAFMSHKATIAGASLLLLAGVTAVAVPQFKKDKPGSSLASSAATPDRGDGSSTKSAESSALPRTKGRENPANQRLTEKYGDARTKLSAHLYGEFIGLMDDTMAVMDMAHKMDLGEGMAEEPEEIFGDAAESLALNEDQKKQLVTLQAESLKRESEKMQGMITTLKQDPSKFMEYLLLQDAAKRGDIDRAEYDRVLGTLEIPEDEMEFSIGNSDDESPLDDEVFVEDFTKLLDENQAELLRALVEGRVKEKPADNHDPHTLEELEKQIASGRKMIGGAKQLMEGITDGGLNPSK